MAYDVNSALERLEQNLTQLDSARKQVEKTVHASNDLQTIVAGYVASINKLVGEIKEWEKSLEGIQIKFSESANKALTDMKASCEKISTDFSASVDDSIKKFSEQNSLLEKKVKEMDALRDEIKSATKEIQTVKDLLSNISKDLKDSQNKQDETLNNISQVVSGLPETMKGHTDKIIEQANDAKKDLKAILDETKPIITGIDGKADSLAQSITTLQTSVGSVKSSCDKIKSTLDGIKEEIEAVKNATAKSININRWIIIAGFIILIALHFI
jgi:chromosome segregation ATPase